jgi:hypothetical protein
MSPFPPFRFFGEVANYVCTRNSRGTHAKRQFKVYISISHADLLNAIDRMTFDKGDTEIFVKM